MARTKKSSFAADQLGGPTEPAERDPELAGVDMEPAKPVKLTIGSFIKARIKETSLTNMEILAAVQAEFPTAKTSYACIAWYKTQLRKSGEIGARVFAKKAAE